MNAENNPKNKCRKQPKKQIQKISTKKQLKNYDYENNCKKCNNK